MQKWEYLIRVARLTLEELNELGADGWELIEVIYFEYTRSTPKFYFKRPKS